jgi:hypothetical protein
VDDRVGLLGAATKGRRIFEIAPVSLDARLAELGGTGVGASETEHLVPSLEELRDDVGADEAGRAGEEYSHGISLVPVVGLC